ncbi:MAG: hypothetical protein VXW65_00335 [Pseudomonadota bacterium]|nr:hypothetical protein [Pseudomonadota bacterium]
MNISATTSTPTQFALSFIHKENVDEGVEVHVQLTGPDTGAVTAQDIGVVLQIFDLNGVRLQKIAGKLHPDAVDEFGEIQFIGDLADTLNDAVSVEVGNLSDADLVQLWADYVAAGKPIYRDTVQAYDNGFEMGDPISYTIDEKSRSVQQLADTKDYYGYLMSPYSGDYALQAVMATKAAELNVPFAYEWHPDDVSAEDMPMLMSTLNINSDYAQGYYSPWLSNDPYVGGWTWMPYVGVQLAERCKRNAQKNENNISKRHKVIAGNDYPIINRRMRPHGGTAIIDDQIELVAQARMNPVILRKQGVSSLYICNDSLTTKITTGPLKLIAVNEVGVAIDADLVMISVDALQQPMSYIDTLRTRLRDRLDAYKTKTGGDNESVIIDYTLKVYPDPAAPLEKVRVEVSVLHNGTIRYIQITRTVDRRNGAVSPTLSQAA